MERNYDRAVSTGSHARVGSSDSAESFGEHDLEDHVVDVQVGSNTVHDGHRQEERSTLNSNAPDNVISPAGSRHSVYSPVAGVHSSSFNFDDTDDEDEENLKRYNLDFSIDADRATLSNSMHGGTTFQNSTQRGSTIVQIVQHLWDSFQSQRQKARQRRAQLLLQQSERNFRQSFWICLNTYCDATDGGLMLFAFLVVLWVITLMSISEGRATRHCFLVGVFFIALRLGARPLSGYYTRQRQRRRLQSQDRQSHHVLPTQSPAPKQLRQRVNSGDGYDESPQRRYQDEPPKSGNLELQGVDNNK